MTVFTGSCVALSTPFTESGINYDTFKELIEFQISEGTDALLVCGTTGEPPTMTLNERYEAMDFVVKEAAGRLPVIAGTGGNNTKEVIKSSIKAQELGADALLIVTPYYNKTTQKGLIAHYTAISESVDIPIIIYNVPGRTGLNMTANTLFELSKLENIVGMKEASGNISQVVEMSRLCNETIDMYSGNDDMIVPLMSVGGKGVISVVANVAPRDTHDMVMSYLEGDVEKSYKLQFKLKPLIDALFLEVNPIPVKAALNLMGFDMGSPRLPLIDMSQENLATLRRCMQDLNLL
ncbi:MAG: 4-hydroxy-tetrahydrodipicolinate synthase [Clostridiales bacterium]|nr:4-hydroxy-tetrahydrodipicolinate synthase [Clostridiales bacterium]